MQPFTFSISSFITIGRNLRNFGLKIVTALLVAFLGNQLLGHKPLYGAEFFCPSGNVNCLIAAINEANGLPGDHTIFLEPGTYTLTVIDNTTDGPNGLPSIRSSITIRQDEMLATIERDLGAQQFRIFHVSNGGTLNLFGLGLRGGIGAILNSGRLTVDRLAIYQNTGVAIINGNSATISNTSISDNGAGVSRFGLSSTVIVGSFIYRNLGFGISSLQTPFAVIRTAVYENGGDGINGDTGIIASSTIARNGRNGITLSGHLSGLILNSTIFGNTEADLFMVRSVASLQNSVVGRCSSDGGLESLGHNILADLTGCQGDFHPTDIETDPRLGDFNSSGGFFPLLAGSPAIDSANPDACPETDQLGTPRRDRCDIGAIEFYPLVNDLVALVNVSTHFDATPVLGGPAGTFRIAAEFTNTSTQTIGHRFAEVVELSGGNLLLNADRGAGGVGARLTLPDSATSPFLPGATETLEFLIGLQNLEPFTFLVNMLGDPGSSTPLLAQSSAP